MASDRNARRHADPLDVSSEGRAPRLPIRAAHFVAVGALVAVVVDMHEVRDVRAALDTLHKGDAQSSPSTSRRG